MNAEHQTAPHKFGPIKAELTRFTAAEPSERFQLLPKYTPQELSDLIVFAVVEARKPQATWNNRTANQDLQRHRESRRHVARSLSQKRTTA